jgi:hypothetical protein
VLGLLVVAAVRRDDLQLLGEVEHVAGLQLEAELVDPLGEGKRVLVLAVATVRNVAFTAGSGARSHQALRYS